ncbi:PDZ domain-containing protein [Streptomyces olivoverticillatus]|uniref:PDZ domain-containing protein n=1 Tax=Streptomyces olivoverticillatus TaxID=66427 RepID=A0A7W7LM51_9ACTN|nr:S16 family serine protease [Streptomyces olivoverticillatus]MBB4892166.1 PDZ domain-containing protein [Streptomyces olivoverticillatus]
MPAADSTPAKPSAKDKRVRTLAVCAAPVVALLAVAALVPLPFAIAEPGSTVNVLGSDKNHQVITVTGAPSRKTSGQLRMTTITATGPAVEISLPDVVDGWFRTDRAVMPHDAVYPAGQTDQEVEQHNVAEMKKSQDSATQAALRYLGRSPKDVKVDLRLADIGGPSAGLLFALGIVDKLDGDGRGGDLTGGRTIAGTGTIDPDGTVGAVGGVSLKEQAAKRDGATVFLVPKDECSDASAELPRGLRLIPVTELKGAIDALKALASGGNVPSCPAA